MKVDSNKLISRSLIWSLLLFCATILQTRAQTASRNDRGVAASTDNVEGNDQSGPVTAADHFHKLADSTVATPGGAIETAVAPVITAGFSQLLTSHVGFDSNAVGFGQHYSVNLLGNVSGKFLGKFVLPSVLHQDEIYQPYGPDISLALRLRHILVHVFVTRSADHTRRVFNASAIPNSLLTALLSNSYQPAEQRTAEDSAARFGYNVLGFVAGDSFTEFEPELRKVVGLLKSRITSTSPWRPK